MSGSEVRSPRATTRGSATGRHRPTPPRGRWRRGVRADPRSEIGGQDPLGRPEGRLAQHVVKLWGMGGRDQRTESREQKRRF
jgi:hypothetical protein